MPTYRERNGRVNVQVRIKQSGAIVHQESATFDTRAQAKAWATAVERRISQQGVAARQQSKVTLGDLFDKHIAMLERSGRETFAMKAKFKDFSSHPIYSKSVDRLTSKDFIDWGIEYAMGRSPATVLNHLMGVRAAYRAAPVAHNIPLDISVVGNAVHHLRLMQVVAPSKERDRRVSDAEVLAIEQHWKRLEGTTIPMPLLVRFLIALPRRREEVLGVMWDDYDPVNHTLLLRDTKHPTKPRDELIPVPRAAQAILAGLHRRPGERIFPYLGSSLSRSFQSAAKMVGLKDIRLHDLRHEGVSRLFEMGLNIPEVSFISGHRSWASLKRYTQLQPKHVLEKLDASSKRAQETTAQPERPR